MEWEGITEKGKGNNEKIEKGKGREGKIEMEGWV